MSVQTAAPSAAQPVSASLPVRNNRDPWDHDGEDGDASPIVYATPTDCGCRNTDGKCLCNTHG